MWRLFPAQVLWLVLSVIVNAQENEQDTTNGDLSSRLAALEELLSSQAIAQESLRAALQLETTKRLTLEGKLDAYIEEQETKMEQLTSLLQVAKDRVAALDGTIQGEIRLREEAEITAGEVILQLTTKIDNVERDLTLLTLLNSRLRELENKQGIQIEDILNLQNSISQLRKTINREKKTIEQLASSLEPIAFRASENSKSLTDFSHHISQLKSWLISYNESAVEGNAGLSNLQSDVLQLTQNIQAIEISIANLTSSVMHLHHLTPKKMLKLCPSGYRKVGEDCYQLLESKMSWETARLKCEELGILAGGIGDLAVPTQLQAFRNFVDRIKPESDYLWIGASREDDGRWLWVSGKPLAEIDFPWDLGEPDEGENQHQLCVKANGSIKFHDCIAGSLLGAICHLR